MSQTKVPLKTFFFFISSININVFPEGGFPVPQIVIVSSRLSQTFRRYHLPSPVSCPIVRRVPLWNTRTFPRGHVNYVLSLGTTWDFWWRNSGAFPGFYWSNFVCFFILFFQSFLVDFTSGLKLRYELPWISTSNPKISLRQYWVIFY